MSPIVRVAEAQRSETEGFTAYGIATPQLGSREHVVCRAVSAAGRRGRLHSHDREEIVVVLCGEGIAFVGDDEASVYEGDVIIVPAGELHAFAAVTDSFEVLTVEPVGIRFFDEDGAEYEAPAVMA